MLHDRRQAAHRLADRLGHLRGLRPVFVGCSPGGLILGRALADALGGDLDAIMVRCLRAPHDPEQVLAAVDEAGRITDLAPIHTSRPPPDELRAFARTEGAHLREQHQTLLGDRPPIDLRRRLVVVVDEGATSGAAMVAAVRAAREASAGRIVVALPVASAPAVAALRRESDEIVVLFQPIMLDEVSTCYTELPPVRDAELVEAMDR